MVPLGHHIRIRLADNRVIAPTPKQQRLITRIVLEQGRRDTLLCTSLAGTHLHLDALCSEARSSRLVQRITSSVKQRLTLPLGFTHYPHEPIRDHRHLCYSTRYIFTQHQHHGLPPEQTLDGTNLPDLLGMRFIGSYTLENLRKWLPQLRRSQLIEWLGVTDLHTAEGTVDDVVQAALAAAALCDLHRSSPRVITTRRAIVELVDNRLSTAELCELFAIRPRTLTWLRRRPVDHRLVHAIRLQVGTRAALRSRRHDWNNEIPA